MGLSPCQRVQVSIRNVSRCPHAARPDGKCAPFTWWLVAALEAGSGLPGSTLLNKGTLCRQGRSDMLKAPQIANLPLAEWPQKMWMWI